MTETPSSPALHRRSDGFVETPDGNVVVEMRTRTKVERDGTKTFRFKASVTAQAISLSWSRADNIALFPLDVATILIARGWASNIDDAKLAELLAEVQSDTANDGSGEGTATEPATSPAQAQEPPAGTPATPEASTPAPAPAPAPAQPAAAPAKDKEPVEPAEPTKPKAPAKPAAKKNPPAAPPKA